MNRCLKLVEKTVSADVDWSHPMMGANPFMMAMTWQMGIVKTMVEAHQKKVETFMKTGAWPV